MKNLILLEGSISKIKKKLMKIEKSMRKNEEKKKKCFV